MIHLNVSPTHLTQGKCKPCEGGVEPMTEAEIKPYLESVPAWQKTTVNNHGAIVREYTLKNFMAVISFVNQIADIAEAEGHHPNLYINSYKKLRIELYTHAIGGLSINDFILAAKIDALGN